MLNKYKFTMGSDMNKEWVWQLKQEVNNFEYLRRKFGFTFPQVGWRRGKIKELLKIIYKPDCSKIK